MAAPVDADKAAEAAVEVAVPPNPCKLYVGNLPLATQDDELKAFFEGVGAVACVDLKRDKMGRCRCARRALHTQKSPTPPVKEPYIALKEPYIDLQRGKMDRCRCAQRAL